MSENPVRSSFAPSSTIAGPRPSGFAGLLISGASKSAPESSPESPVSSSTTTMESGPMSRGTTLFEPSSSEQLRTASNAEREIHIILYIFPARFYLKVLVRRWLRSTALSRIERDEGKPPAKHKIGTDQQRPRRFDTRMTLHQPFR